MSLLFLSGFAIVGAILASFAGVISERLYTGEGWVQGRSRCNSCDRTLSFLDLVPVLSWLVQWGRCRMCRAPLPLRYPLTEALLALLFALSYVTFGSTLALVFFLLSLFFLTVIVLYDLRHTIVPLSFAGLFVLSALAHILALGLPLIFLESILLIAGVIGLGFFLMFAVSKGRWMGLGDAPIAFGLSLLAGTQALAGLLFSFWIGAVIGIVILARTPRGHRMGIEVPFVPFLALGYILAIFTQWNPLPF